jgi:predicted acylesterase/phospholipase RssA
MWQGTGLLVGPGGVKGFKYLGFLLYMEKHGLLEKYDSFAGISVGAVILLLYVAGYSIYDIINEASKANFLEDFSAIQLEDVKRSVGLISQKKLSETLESLIKAKFGKVLTLGELYQATGLELHITSFILDPVDPKPVHYSYKTEPNISCVEAVVLSANLPFIFRRLYYKGKCHVDGALGAPYPIYLLDDGTRDVLGLYITSTFNHPEEFLTYLRQVFYAGMVQLRNDAIKSSSGRCRHVGLTGEEADPVGLTTTSEVKIAMVTNGYEEAKKFFEHDHRNLRIAATNIEVIEEKA